MANLPIRDANGNIVYSKTNVSGSDISNPLIVEHYDASATTQLQIINSLTPSQYDYIALGYDGNNVLTSVTFKIGGVSGSTISTLTLGYTGGNLTSVAKS